jgi:hypothetical protein
VRTQNIDEQLENCGLVQESVAHVLPCSNVSASNNVNEELENSRSQFDGVTTVISTRSKEEESEQSKDSDDDVTAGKLPEKEKYVL